MGGLINLLPFTYVCIFFGSLAIAGFPFLTGFYSKDLLLESIISRYSIDSEFIYFLAISAAFFTSLYSTRMLVFVFGNQVNLFKSYFTSKESTPRMSIVMFLLTILTIFIGYIFNEVMIGFGSFAWGNSIFTKPEHFSQIESEFLDPFTKNLPLLVTILAVFTFFTFTFFLNLIVYNRILYKIINLTFKFFYPAGFFNFIYNNILNFIYKASYHTVTKIIDKGYLELFGPFGLYIYVFSLCIRLKIFSPYVVFQSIFLIFININLLIILTIHFIHLFPIYIYTAFLFIFFLEYK